MASFKKLNAYAVRFNDLNPNDVAGEVFELLKARTFTCHTLVVRDTVVIGVKNEPPLSTTKDMGVKY